MVCEVTGTTLLGMTHFPPPAEELRLLDAELYRLDARRAQLLARRAWLVTALQSAAPGPAPAFAPRSEASAPRVQNVLLLLGGVLLTIAAMAFTLVSWGHLGIVGRAAVLGTVTLATLATPLPLLRRGLRSTAEAVAGLGLALMVLDAYAMHEAALTDTDGTAYAAFATTALAVLWAAYGTALDTLRLPRPAALIAAQLPLLLGAIAVDAGPYGITAALLVTAAADAGVALFATTPSLRSVRIAAAIGAYGLGGWGVLAAVWLSLTSPGPSAAARAAALLTFAAAIAVTAAWRIPETAGLTATAASGAAGRAEDTAAAGSTSPGALPQSPRPADIPILRPPFLSAATALIGGLCLLAGVGGVLRVSVPGGWALPAELVIAVVLLAVVRGRLTETVRRGVGWACTAVQAFTLVWALPLAAIAVLGPLGLLQHPWSGVPADARAAVTTDIPWPSDTGPGLAVLVIVAGALVLLVREPVWRPRASMGAVVLVWAAALAVPATFQLPYSVGLLVPGLVTAAVLAAPLRPPVGVVLALVTSVDLALLALADRTATLTVLSALTALFAAASTRSRLAPVTAPAALAYATALACATGAAAGWQPQHTALLVLAVPAAAVLVAPRLGDAARLGTEVTGAVAGLVALTLAVTDPPLLALVLALLGVIVAATAVHPDRRRVGYVAAVLFVLATWIRLAAWEVATPEAYTLSVTVPALLVGAWRRHRDPQARSWTAYGPGLTATLAPSLVTTWHDEGWQRPLLLGAAALVVTLLGARHRMQAPLVLGGSALVLVALHELTPYLVQVADALPRWVPPALAGLLLLAVGATYEQRIRDVRRVREVLGRMN